MNRAIVMKAVVSLLAVFCGLLMAPAAAQADLVLTYDVNIVQTSVNVGDTIDWQVFATVAGTPNVGSNFGIAQLSVNLGESEGETMTPGTVGPSFALYANQSGGIPSGTGLNLIGANTLNENFPTVGGGAGGMFLLASGQYTVTQAGIHTLQAAASGDSNLFFSVDGQGLGSATPYDSVTYNFDTVAVTGVPEPSSLLLTGLAAMGAWRLRRRKANEGLEAAS
jgi:hypothetical protein